MSTAGKADGAASRETGPHQRSRPHLHLPDEPGAHREHWRAAVLHGQELACVVGGRHGVAGWLWARWSTLDAHGMDKETFSSVVVEYRRELWLWLAGDRKWEQCCAGLIGRIGRRLGSPTP